MTKSVEFLTREEKILLESVRNSGLPVKKLLNEINNVYRETEHQKAFTEGMKVLGNEVIAPNNVLILASYYSQDYEEPFLFLVEGTTEEELIPLLDDNYDVDDFIKDNYISPSPKELADYLQSKGFNVLRLPTVAFGCYADNSAGKYKPTVEWDRGNDE
jgi:hypothetical protein